ncbi:hypothetical protein [Caenibius sp. WL]|uniref:hypothetical protein n=1 Tax=Caenibius sp. WL TaxID=2872646 RepID=UPI001C991B0C|nr:hypothetical protein [Caenibius sp. WL]QZP07635.1 hypothetical protein K5X80_13340 [Caenibius sp. WL]
MEPSHKACLGALLAVAAVLGPQPGVAEAGAQSPACRTFEAQRKAELAALDLLHTPEVQQARAVAEQEWRRYWGDVASEMEAVFPQALEELVFNAALKTVVNATYPPAMVMMINQPSRHGDVRIPGTRYGWDNTDNIYGTIPVDPQATYRLSGQMTDPGTNLNLSVWAKDGTVLSNLAKAEIPTDPEGRFSLSVGRGAEFDLKLPVNAHHIMVRETIPDWSTGKPVYIDVVRMSGPRPVVPSTQNLSREAAAAVADTVHKMQAWRASLYRKYPANMFVQPWMGQHGNGGLPNQAYSMGYFAITGDEALVFDIALGGAEYFSFQLSDIWGTSGNFVGNVSTLTNRQSRPNADGSYTYVLSIKDPGVSNWISTQGWHEGDVTLRWQQIAGAPGSAQGPAVLVRRVKLPDLASVLPAGSASFRPEERQTQIEQRARNPYSLWMDERCAGSGSRQE